jgi:hypothetical protein
VIGESVRVCYANRKRAYHPESLAERKKKKFGSSQVLFSQAFYRLKLVDKAGLTKPDIRKLKFQE